MRWAELEASMVGIYRNRLDSDDEPLTLSLALPGGILAVICMVSSGMVGLVTWFPI